MLAVASVPTSGPLLFGISLAAAAIPFSVSFFLAWRKGKLSASWVDRLRDSGLPSWEVVVYLLVGVAVSVVLLVKSFDGPESLTQTYDNVLHYGAVRAFLDSGRWSFLSMGQYGTAADAAIDPLMTAGFYPAAWHVVVALLSDTMGVSPALAANAANVLFCSLVFPLGMFAFLSALFPKDRPAVLAGAFASAAFAAFPWALYMSWPLFPYGSSLAALPVVLFSFVGFFARFAQVGRIGFLVIFIVSCISVALLQPSGIFAAALLLAPYCVYLSISAVGGLKVRGWRLFFMRLLAGAAAVVLISGIWVALYRAPFLQAVVNFRWEPSLEPAQAVMDAFVFAVEGNPPQWVLTLLALIGIGCALRRSCLRWLPLSFALSVVVFVAAASLEGEARHLLAGFWYTDPYRVGACVALAGMPLVAYAVAALSKGVSLALPARGRAIGAVFLTFLLGIVVCVGSYLIPVRGATSFGFLLEQGEMNASTGDNRPFGEAKKRFAEKVRDAVGDDALVLNNPYDGSMYAYGSTGLRTYYRDMGGYGASYESPESLAVRERLAEIGSSDDVAAAVRTLGARYLLLLNDESPIGWFSPVYLPVQWEGLTAIDDDTPGFEMVLAEGDMRLYRLEEGEEGSDAD